MRIWFINRFFYPDLSATAQILTELAEDLDARGERITVITGRATYVDGDSVLPRNGTYKGIEIRRVWSTRLGRRAVVGRLLDSVSFYLSALAASRRAKRSDCLVVLTDPPLLSILAAAVRAVKGCRTVCWLQDVFPEIAVRAGVLHEGFPVRCLRRLAAWSLRRMDCVVVLGRCMERHVRELGVSPRQLVRIPNWADGAAIRPLDLAEHPLVDEATSSDRFIVMYSGNLGVVHEVETVMGMIRETRSLGGLRFCFVGDGRHRQGLAELAARERWGHVSFLPYQPKERLAASLSMGDVHLVTLRTEMAGLSVPSKLYGILAAGRPVIFVGPDESEVAHVIREAGCGAVVAPGDVSGAIQAVRTYYKDATLRVLHGQAARAYFERHCDRSIATQRYRQVLQQVYAS